MISRKRESFVKQIRKEFICQRFKRVRTIMNNEAQLNNKFDEFLNKGGPVIPEIFVQNFQHLSLQRLSKAVDLLANLQKICVTNLNFMATILHNHEIYFKEAAQFYDQSLSFVQQNQHIDIHLCESILLFWTQYLHKAQKIKHNDVLLVNEMIQKWWQNYKSINQHIVANFLNVLANIKNIQVDKTIKLITPILMQSVFTKQMTELFLKLYEDNQNLFYYIYSAQQFPKFIIKSLCLVDEISIMNLVFQITLLQNWSIIFGDLALKLAQQVLNIYSLVDSRQIYAITILYYIAEEELQITNHFFRQLDYSIFLTKMIQKNRNDGFELIILILHTYFTKQLWIQLIRNLCIIDHISEHCLQCKNINLMSLLIEVIYQHYNKGSLMAQDVDKLGNIHKILDLQNDKLKQIQKNIYKMDTYD